MKFKSLLLVTTMIFVGYQIHSQQLPLSNLYTINKYNINPAYAGYNNCTEVYGSHLSQWVGIPGSPKTNYLSVHSRLKENMSIGGGITLDKAAFISRFSAKFTYAYLLKLGENQNLRFGLSGGLFQAKVNATNAIVDDMSDEVVSGGVQSGMTFYSDFGMFYNYKKLQLGFAVPQVLQSEAKLNYNGLDGFMERRHYIGFANYDWSVNEEWEVSPSILYKSVQKGINQLDFNATVTYNKFLSVGGGYRTSVGFLARLGINLKNMFNLGYAYVLPGGNISHYSNGSHEIIVGLKLCKDSDLTTLTDPSEENVNSEETSIDLVEDDEVIIEESTPETEENIEQEEVEIVELQDVEEVKTEQKSVEEFKENYKPEILFPYNDGSNYDLSNNDALNELAGFLNEHKDEQIEIVGYTCDIGDEADNITVSNMRANAVYNALLKKGVLASQLKTKAMGEKNPKYPNTSEENRKKNRRVEIVFL